VFLYKTSIEYLGVIIADGQVRMDPAKSLALPSGLSLPRSRDPGLLGFCNFYRHFMQTTLPLHAPLRLNLEDTAFQWTLHIKLRLPHLFPVYPSPCPCLACHTQPFRLIMDASDFATGAILEQPDLLNRGTLCLLFKSLQLAERNYAIHDKELLAIIRALAAFRHYLEGRTMSLNLV